MPAGLHGRARKTFHHLLVVTVFEEEEDREPRMDTDEHGWGPAIQPQRGRT